jgi:hypothetical protein
MVRTALIACPRRQRPQSIDRALRVVLSLDSDFKGVPEASSRALNKRQQSQKRGQEQ